MSEAYVSTAAPTATIDLEALRTRYLPDLEILETEHTDYRFGAFVQREEWAHAVQTLAADIDYPSLKNAVAERQGYVRAKRYGEIWQVMYGLRRQG